MRKKRQVKLDVNKILKIYTFVVILGSIFMFAQIANASRITTTERTVDTQEAFHIEDLTIDNQQNHYFENLTAQYLERLSESISKTSSSIVFHQKTEEEKAEEKARQKEIKEKQAILNSKQQETSVAPATQQKVIAVSSDIQSGCGGNWLYVPTLSSRISLAYTSLSSWTLANPPSFVNETVNNSNIVAIGHNYCSNGNCNQPGSEWGKILNARLGQKGELCKQNEYYSGNILHSDAVSEFDTHIMGNWLNKNTLTAFASYGQCKDPSCSATDQRWVIAFERN